MKLLRRFVIVLSLGLVGCSNGTATSVIVVGHVSDKTRLDKAGDNAELGIRLALHELEKDDALSKELGGRKVQPHHTDTRGNLDAFEAEAVRLEAINRAAALMGGLSAKEVSALDHVKAPLLTFYGQPVSGAGKNVFYLGMIPARQGTALAKVTADNAKIKRVVLLLDERLPEASPVAESFTAVFNEARKGQAVVLVRFGKDAKWSEVSERIVGHDAQAIVFVGLADDFNACSKSLRRDAFLSVELIYAGPDGGQRGFELELRPNQSVLLATALNPDPAFEKGAAFRRAFREAFQSEADVHAALAYDGFRVLAEAMKQVHAQPVGVDRLREELLKIKDFDAITGPITINADRQVQRPLYVANWRNGVLTLVRKIDP